METETLSNYEQSQAKHILDDMNINTPTHDDNSNSLHLNEISETDSDFCTEPVSSSDKIVKEENCDEIVSSSENKVDSDDNIEENFVGGNKNTLNKSINSPNVSSTNHDDENGKNSSNDQDGCLSDEDKHISLQEEQDKECPSTEEVRDPLGNEVEDVSDNNIDCTKNEENLNRNSFDKENKSDSPCESNGKKENCQNSINGVVPEDINDINTKENEENNETDEINTDPFDDSKELEKSSDGNVQNCSLLKETLTRQREDIAEDKETAENENVADEMDMDDDFDPSLLCPDIAMEVDEAPVITTTDVVPTDGNKSPQLYDPVYSTYVDEMTGAEVTFNLTSEEHQMRQETYGEHNPIQFTKIHCTACNVHLGSALDGQSNRFVHPLLKVLICKDCYHFYTSGEFEKDEDGSELYCRWCGQGGQVMCCSACEMVFCKKCIRINFGRKKLTEIRDSDDWFCFRCNTSQLTALRVHCAEFMEYVRREISRAATLEDATSFMTTDYTQCCLSQKKKYVDPHSPEPKKRRKKFVDPDYDPEKDIIKSNSPTPDKTPPIIVPILPIASEPTHKIGPVTQTSQAATQGTMFRVGNTIFRPRGAFTQIRPGAPVSVVQPRVGTSALRPQMSTPGFIKIMPSGIRAATSTSRQPAQTFVSTSVRPQSFQQRHIRMPGNANGAAMKHEWFEKTVRAAARVNSNLSYTLTQLNRAQATASSVEALAVVHNKLQEILSTSINSLIQIRKNLRAEFIAGIKNIRAPPKPPMPRPMPSTSAQDDDVIFVSPTTSPVPPPITVGTTSQLTPSVTLTNSSNTTKRSSIPIVPTTSLQLIPGTSTISNGDKPKSFLRVKSLSALQNVTAECIMIPDDPVPSFSLRCSSPVTILEDVEVAKDEEKGKEKEEDAYKEESEKETEDLTSKEETEKETEDSASKEEIEKETEDSAPIEEAEKDTEDSTSTGEAEKDTEDSTSKGETEKDTEDSTSKGEAEKDTEDPAPKENFETTAADSEIEDKNSEEAVAKEKCDESLIADKDIDMEKSNSSSDEIDDVSLAASLEDQPHFSDLDMMFNLKVYLKRSEEIDELVRKKFKLLNGDTSE